MILSSKFISVLAEDAIRAALNDYKVKNNDDEPDPPAKAEASN